MWRNLGKMVRVGLWGFVWFGFLIGTRVLADVALYTLAVLVDGDYLNDWVTHLPEFLRDEALIWGQLLETILN